MTQSLRNKNHFEPNPTLSLWLLSIKNHEWIRNLAWPLIFWSWVLLVTVWLETLSLRAMYQDSGDKNSSSIVFRRILFQQSQQNESRISMQSTQAIYDNQSGQFLIEQPFIQYYQQKPDSLLSELVFSATGNMGYFTAQQTDSAFPSDFRFLTLTDGTQIHAVNMNSRVDSESVLFDNNTRLFYFPDQFRFQREKMGKGQSEKMVFNPIDGSMAPFDIESVSDQPLVRKIKEIQLEVQ